ncbi:MAG: hypothetical protein ACXIUV_07485 [Alkalilacustris sp.]
MAEALALPVERMREYLDRLLAHPAWPGSPRRSALLRHLVTETLAGRGARLKGAAIAMELFGDRAGGTLQADAIVRVEAGRLRRDLDSYYVGAGRDDPIRISIPKGGYRAVFDLAGARNAPVPVAAAQPYETGSHAGAGASDLPRVLVRPFVALGGEPRLREIAEGLTHEVISGLMRFPGFRLHSVEDSFGLVAAPPAAPAGVAYSVRAAVQSEGGDMKVSVRLAEASDGRVVWSHTFTRPLSARSLIAVQSEIAGDIASALGKPAEGLREGVIARIARSGAPSMDSYLAVLAAQAYRRTHLQEAYADTRAGLERAVLCDPGYADAWAHLAFLRLDGQRFGHAPQAERGNFSLALSAARRALALDPDTIPGHLALLLIQHYAGAAAEALATAEQALRISPHDADALASMGWLRVIGQNDPTGLAYLERAIARSVNPPPRYFRSVAVHRMMWGEAQPFLGAAQRAAADGFAISAALLAIACGRLGQRAEAADALATMARRSPALAADPAAFLAPHRTHPTIIAAIEAGLRNAGWTMRQDRRPG